MSDMGRGWLTIGEPRALEKAGKAFDKRCCIGTAFGPQSPYFVAF